MKKLIIASALLLVGMASFATIIYNSDCCDKNDTCCTPKSECCTK